MSTSVLFTALDILSSTSLHDGSKDTKENVVQRLSTNLERVKEYLKHQGDFGLKDCGKNGNAAVSVFDESSDSASFLSSSPQFIDEFFHVSLEILDRLCHFSDSNTLWSVKEEATLKRCLQLIVVLGILSHLHRNIGVPLHRRTTTGVTFADFEGEVCWRGGRRRDKRKGK